VLSLKNKTVLITGAAGNLGRSVAATFGATGANLVLVDQNGAALDAAYPGHEGNRVKRPVNLMVPDEIEAVVTEVEGGFGQIDALVALAGGFHMGEAVHSLSVDKWDLMMNLNVRTLLHSTAVVVPKMIKNGYGKIVTIGANAASQGRANMGAYIAAKSAVIRLTEAMSLELRGEGVNVNCVMPSIIDTLENRIAMPAIDPKNWVSPEKLANVILFLCSEEASAVHGACIPVVGLS
tara:strand:- start:3061 stop:3768 length:708 start_codon:yes stop_codon:yes gene_type:complete